MTHGAEKILCMLSIIRAPKRRAEREAPGGVMAAGCGSGVKVLLSNVGSCGAEEAQEISSFPAYFRGRFDSCRSGKRRKSPTLNGNKPVF